MWLLTSIASGGVGYAGYWFCGFAVLCLLVTIGKERLRRWKLKKRSVATARWRNRGMALWLPMWFSVFAEGIFIIAIANHEAFPIANYTDVTIYPKNENGDWRMDGQEEFGKHLYRRGIMFHPCEPKLVEAMLKQAAGEGWIAHDVSWQQRPNCQSVFDPQFGFNFNDEQGHYRRVSNARTTAQ